MTREPGSRQRRPARSLAFEPLEGRRLLSSFYSGPTPIRPVQSAGGVYTLSVNGPGLIKVQHLPKGLLGVSLFGTTAASTLNVALTRPRLHTPAANLPIGSIRVVSGRIGAINAGAATLLGAVTPINGTVNGLRFGGLGPNAGIDVNGSVGVFDLGGVALGPGGHVRVSGDVTRALTVGGTLAIDGGKFSVGHDLIGPLTAGAVDVTNGGAFVVGHDAAGVARVAGNLTVNTSGIVSFGRDVTQGIDVVGDLGLASGGRLSVGRTLNSLRVEGDLTVAPAGAGISTGGNLNDLTVDGSFVGNGTRSPDLSVGLDLNGFSVLGGTANAGAVRGASVEVGKNLSNLNVPHGIFDSFVTAGVDINGVSVGPDGFDALVNSEIRAGQRITAMTLVGNVRSTFPVDPRAAGYPTRIVAGEERSGAFNSGGVIANLDIAGSLIDSVVAASVAPNGVDGTLPPTGPYAPPRVCGTDPGDAGHNTYDQPAGTTTVGNTVFANFTEETLVNGVLKVTYNTEGDPTIDDCILPGSITGTFIRNVVSTPHGDEFDYAGIFAADTRGVTVGPPA